MTEAEALIQRTLKASTARDVYSKEEVVDLLLDLLVMITKVPELTTT